MYFKLSTSLCRYSCFNILKLYSAFYHNTLLNFHEYNDGEEFVENFSGNYNTAINNFVDFTNNCRFIEFSVSENASNFWEENSGGILSFHENGIHRKRKRERGRENKCEKAHTTVKWQSARDIHQGKVCERESEIERERGKKSSEFCRVCRFTTRR